MSATLKELRAHLVAAKTALSAGNLAAARESCKSALGVDDESYEAWTFDGKVAFASGDATGALESYKRAVGIRNDHPAAWQGIAEAAETTGAHAECAAALDILIRMPIDDRSKHTGDKKAEWRRKRASALAAAGAWGDASDAWTEIAAETMGEGSTDASIVEGSTRVNDAWRMAAECACSANAAAAAAAAEAAAAEAQRTSVTSRADVASIRSTVMRSHDARSDPRLERTLRSYLERTPPSNESDPKLEYVHSLHGRLLTRARARTAATGAREDAMDAMDEAEAIVARHGDDAPGVAAACRAAALESICALDLGLDVEEEGWDYLDERYSGDGEAGDERYSGDFKRASLERRAARLVSVGSEPSLESADPCEAVAAAWLRLRESGRSGRAAHPPGSAAGAAALPRPGLVALGDALAADESARIGSASDAASTRVITTEASEAAAAAAAAAAPDPLGPGARVVGWSAAAEAAHMAGDAAVALEHARRALKACLALGWFDSTERGSTAPGGARGCERRVRIVAAEALLSVGRRREAAAALGALNDAAESPRTLRGLAMCRDGSLEGSSAKDGEGCVAALKRAASLAPNAPRPLAELGWIMLRGGGDGAGARATRLLERAAELTAGSVPPDVDAKLGVARWMEKIGAIDGGVSAEEHALQAKEYALSRGPNTAHASLLNAASRVGPFQPLAFAYLARMYDAANDASRAEKCRARALSLDPADPIAGPDECAARGDDHAYVARTCRDALRAKPRCLWAAVRLAPAASRLGDHEAAVGALQTVLRSVPDSSAAWEALGAAYDALNRHSAALKAYGRAMDIERERAGLGSGLNGSGLTTNSIHPGGRVFASVRSGRIMQQMGAVRESIAAYETALAVAPGHTAALLGLAEAELGRARLAAGRAPGAAAASAERAAEAAHAAAAKPGTDAPKRTVVKLIGDAMMVIARCRDPKAMYIDDDAIATEAVEPSAATRAARANAAARTAARRARRAYARAIHLEPNAACAWRDLAGACIAEGDACASRGVESPGRDESPANLKRRDEAERCLRGALRVDTADPATWTAIGTLPGAEGADPTRDIARRETALARAVALDPRCAPAWSALGRLYLRRAKGAEADPGERGVFISRAQRALDNARAADPSDANAWVGTALLHSARGDEGETAGAFRMASDLGAGREADTYRALSGLRAAAEVAAAAASEGAFKPTHDAGTKVTSVGGAYAAARRAVEAAPGDPTARLSLALASEAKGLFVEAASAYDDAAALLSHTGTTHTGDTRGIAIDPDVLAREASAGAERARAGIERGARRTGAGSVELEGSESIANVDDVASIAEYVRSARATFREGFESHARVARVEALAGAAAALAGDPNAAARSLAKAVHLSPRDVAIRGDLARVLVTADASGAAIKGAGSLVPAPTAGSVGLALNPLASPRVSVEARESVTRATVSSAAALLAAGNANAGTGDTLAGVRLAKAYHLSPSGAAGDDAYALMALVTARRAAVGDGWGPGFRLAAARRCAAVAEAVLGRDNPNPHIAAALTAAACESALVGGRVDVALVHARRCAEVARVHGETNAVGVIPAVLAATAAARCAWASGDAATAAAELRSAIFAASEGARVCASHAPAAITSSATRVHPRVVSAAGDAAAALFALLPGASVDVPPGSSTALTMAAACASLAVGDFKAAEALLRDAQRGAVDLVGSSGGVQPLCAAASKALLGASLAARAKPTEVGGGGDPKAAKEAGKVLARAMRAAGLGTTLAAACGTVGVEAELAKGGGGEGDGEERARLARAGWAKAGSATPAAAHAAAAQLCGSSPRGRVDAQKAVHAAPWAVDHWHRLWQRPDYHRRA